MRIKQSRIPEALILRISTRRSLPRETVSGILSHNILTVRQLQTLTGVTWNKIKGLTYNKRYPRQPQLRSIHPFQCLLSKGPEFIVVDKECIRFIEESLNPEGE
jgi:hypothetical protein